MTWKLFPPAVQFSVIYYITICVLYGYIEFAVVYFMPLGNECENPERAQVITIAGSFIEIQRICITGQPN